MATGWLHGARTVLAVPTVAATLAGLAAHRMVFGINTLLVLVMVRHGDTQSVAGLGTAALFFGATGIGVVPRDRPRRPAPSAGGAVTARPTARWRSRRSSSSAASGLQLPMMVLCGFLLGAAGQVVKLCADTAMQIDVDDALRGHVFAVQDALFWMSFIVAHRQRRRRSSPPTAAPPGWSSPASAVYWSGWRRTPASAAARKPRAKVTGMATAGPIVDDLRAESDELDALVADLPAERWADATPAPGWTIAHQIAQAGRRLWRRGRRFPHGGQPRSAPLSTCRGPGRGAVRGSNMDGQPTRYTTDPADHQGGLSDRRGVAANVIATRNDIQNSESWTVNTCPRRASSTSICIAVSAGGFTTCPAARGRIRRAPSGEAAGPSRGSWTTAANASARLGAAYRPHQSKNHRVNAVARRSRGPAAARKDTEVPVAPRRPRYRSAAPSPTPQC